MAGDDDAARTGLGDRSDLPWIERQVVPIPVGDALPYVEEDWIDALVVVESGDIEIECNLGGRRRFQRGSVLWMVGLAVRRIHNASDTPVRLVAVRRRGLSE